VARPRALKKLLAMPHVGTMERLVLYASTIGLSVAGRGGRGVARLGARLHGGSAGIDSSRQGENSGGFPCRRRDDCYPSVAQPAARGPTACQSPGPMQAIAERILPQSTIELLPFLALAITAGLCEEFLYRGFAMAVLGHLGSPAWAAVLISSIFFGLAHLYQGRSGFFSTLVIGTVFRNGPNRIQ